MLDEKNHRILIWDPKPMINLAAYLIFPSTFSVNPVSEHLNGKICQKSSVWAALSILRHPKQPRHCCSDFRQGGRLPFWITFV
jgi:hypothetical protein